MYKNSPLGFLMHCCHVFIDAPEKLPKFGAFFTLETALIHINNLYMWIRAVPSVKNTPYYKMLHIIRLQDKECTTGIILRQPKS